jgi:hypothetical protein
MEPGFGRNLSLVAPFAAKNGGLNDEIARLFAAEAGQKFGAAAARAPSPIYARVKYISGA